MKSKLITFITTFLVSSYSISSTLVSEAKQSSNANPWGYTGLINMPTGDVLEFGEFYITGNYLIRNPGFVGNAHIGIFDKLELGIVGGIPSVGFSGLAGNLKYQLLSPTSSNPTSLAVGLNLIGLQANTKLTTGNYLYMALSHDFNWKFSENNIYNLFSGHLGFGGNFEGSRFMLGLDIPVTQYVNLEAEYIGQMNNFQEMINFGIKAKPLPFLSVSFLTLGTSRQGFDNTEFLLNVSFNSKIPGLSKLGKKDDKSNDKVAVKKNTKKEEKPSLTLPPNPPKTKTENKEEEHNHKSEPIKTGSIAIGSIKGTVKTNSEENIENVIVSITNTKGNLLKKTFTNTNGVFNISDLPEGEYTVTLSKQGFSDSKRKLLVKSGEATETLFTLEGSSGTLTGRLLDNNGNPISGLIVTIDKQKRTESDKNGNYSFNNLSPGYHLLSIYKDDKEVKSLDLDILASKELKREVILNIKEEEKPSTEILRNSTIQGLIKEINGGIKGARIMIEGEKLTVMTTSGNDGNYFIKNLPSGNYKMTISKEGYSTRIFLIKIKDNQAAKHDVKLSKE